MHCIIYAQLWLIWLDREKRYCFDWPLPSNVQFDIWPYLSAITKNLNVLSLIWYTLKWFWRHSVYLCSHSIYFELSQICYFSLLTMCKIYWQNILSLTLLECVQNQLLECIQKKLHKFKLVSQKQRIRHLAVRETAPHVRFAKWK